MVTSREHMQRMYDHMTAQQMPQSRLESAAAALLAGQDVTHEETNLVLRVVLKHLMEKKHAPLRLSPGPLGSPPSYPRAGLPYSEAPNIGGGCYEG